MVRDALNAIAEKARASRKKTVIRCCMAAGCMSSNSEAVKKNLEQAVKDAGFKAFPGERAGVFIGLGLDLNTTNFDLRWSLAETGRRWAKELGWDLSPEVDAEWLRLLREAVIAVSRHQQVPVQPQMVLLKELSQGRVVAPCDRGGQLEDGRTRLGRHGTGGVSGKQMGRLAQSRLRAPAGEAAPWCRSEVASPMP